jgi:serine/threonine protein kinase
MLIEQLSIVELVDLLLLITLQHASPAMMISPTDKHHRVSFGLRSNTEDVTLPSSVGDAVVARLSVLGGLDLSGATTQFGHLRVKLGESEEELALGIRSTLYGFSAELLRLATRARSGVSGADFDAYELKQELGRGGLGAVYLAVHKPLGRMVAIKLLHANEDKDPLYAERFIREAQAAGRVRHPCVVEIFDFGYTPDHRPFLVMEFIKGKTLCAQLKEPMPPVQALEIAYQVASALGAVHSAGVIHRDLKPENIFVGENNWVKIVDFGAAKDNSNRNLPNITQPGGLIIGTPHYMSPEHIYGAAVDHRTDIYALGCVLFEMLSGKTPYQGTTSMEILLAHCKDPIPEVTSPYEPLPSILNDIIQKALDKNPEKRYQSAAEMGLELERAKFALSRKGWRRWLPL